MTATATASRRSEPLYARARGPVAVAVAADIHRLKRTGEQPMRGGEQVRTFTFYAGVFVVTYVVALGAKLLVFGT